MFSFQSSFPATSGQASNDPNKSKPTDGTQSDSALSNPLTGIQSVGAGLSGVSGVGGGGGGGGGPSSMAASSTELAAAGLGGAAGAGGKVKRRPSMAKALVILGLSKKSNSASNLTMGKRFGFARSEEYGVMHELRNRNLSPPSDGASQDEKNKPK